MYISWILVVCKQFIKKDNKYKKLYVDLRSNSVNLNDETTTIF